ncbi:DNA damage response protein RcaA [Aspergillus candidus]|uniref:FHA domain-containing protein n=1 Tax=Aspergillus candidus TaxID=41067 RepID=A0A2I2FAA9_ASPCN|nr:hypothetical protein BDW47DRAFT_106813 [Aspergillus candidus]PLB37549.1 hypothetical protein BDW47DRAFT_106813 [Aspergillus candidus]
MWILDSEGDFLQGKRVWLKPGKKYLFGRSKQDDVRHAIDHNSISRKHLIIEVSPIDETDRSDIHARSKLTVTDLKSKVGTTVDGEAIKGESRTLGDDEHTVRLGRYKHVLRLKWQPTVLSFSFSSKELKAKDPLAHVRSRLEDLDIKTIIPFVVGSTTHVVQNKRNTAKGLQALVNGKYIVKETFIDALVYAATPSDLDNLESLSPLEADFDSAWPDAMEHLPAPGKEAVVRPTEAFVPNPDRINVFEGYTFVFGDPGQFENLQAFITEGHGRPLLYPIENGVTTAEEIVHFMEEAAGPNGLGSQRDGPGGVVHVRYHAKGRYEDWSIELSNQVALKTDQRVIEQSEFLDAILANNAAPLCRTLPVSSPHEGATAERLSTSASNSTTPAPNSTTPAPISTTPAPNSNTPAPNSNTPDLADSQPSEEPSQPKAKVKRSRNYVSKMKTFDDGFDINSIPAYAPEDDDPESLPPMATEAEPEAESEPMEVTQPADSLQEEEDVVSSLLPGAAAMKRRRAETVQRSTSDPSQQVEKTEPKAKRQKLDVLDAARRHREAEENARREEEEASHRDTLEDADVEKLKGLAIVEEMEMPSRRTTDEDDRWDERWNGRKNFKKFRRKGDRNQRSRIQTLIVPLEEVTRQDFGIGEQHWVSRRPSPEGNRPERSIPTEPVDVDDRSEMRVQSTGRTASETPARSQPRSQKRVRDESGSDSDEETRFRFRRRR